MSKKIADSSGHTTKVDIIALYNEYSFNNNKFNSSIDLINHLYEKYKKFIEDLLNSYININDENKKVSIIEKIEKYHLKKIRC